MLSKDLHLHHHPKDGHATCWGLLQESLHALQMGDDHRALLHADHAVGVGQQEACAECLRCAFWHLGCVHVHRKDYARAAMSFVRVQQLAQDTQEESLVEMSTVSHQLSLVLQQMTVVDQQLSEIGNQLSQRLVAVAARFGTALTAATRYRFAELGDNLDASSDHSAQTDGLAPGEAASQSQADFTIRCLGAFAVYHNGQQLTFPRNRKADAVLKYLVLHRDRPVSRDILMDLGWPDAAPEVASNNLNTTISVVRNNLAKTLARQLRGSPILFEDGHYCLNPALILFIDVAEFDACCKRGLAYERDGRVAEAMAAYQAAISLYQGDLLMGDLYDDRTIIERERLASTFLMLLSKLGEYHLAQGNYQEAIGYAHRLLEHDPCREDAHRLLMYCFARLGQRVQALRQYELCQSLLRRDLDIEPAAETIALRGRIAQGERV